MLANNSSTVHPRVLRFLSWLSSRALAQHWVTRTKNFSTRARTKYNPHLPYPAASSTRTRTQSSAGSRPWPAPCRTLMGIHRCSGDSDARATQYGIERRFHDVIKATLSVWTGSMYHHPSNRMESRCSNRCIRQQWPRSKWHSLQALRQSANAPGCTCRAVSAALHTPQLGDPSCHRGPQFQSRHHLAPQRKLRSPNWNMKH